MRSPASCPQRQTAGSAAKRERSAKLARTSSSSCASVLVVLLLLLLEPDYSSTVVLVVDHRTATNTSSLSALQGFATALTAREAAALTLPRERHEDTFFGKGSGSPSTALICATLWRIGSRNVARRAEIYEKI